LARPVAADTRTIVLRAIVSSGYGWRWQRFPGVRTTHDIDVFVKSHYVGFDVLWIVECKHWSKPVTKLHVLALREIVADVGADRGIIVSEAGFQSGAVEAATLTNIHITSLAGLRSTTSTEVVAMRLRELYDRIEACRERYWKIPKYTRIEFGLRPDTGECGYSGDVVVELAEEVIARALRGCYPFDADSVQSLVTFGDGRRFASASEVISILEPMIIDLEAKLTACETNRLIRFGDGPK
jgi:restriction system protein